MNHRATLLAAALLACTLAVAQSRRPDAYYGTEREPGWGDARAASPAAVPPSPVPPAAPPMVAAPLPAAVAETPPRPAPPQAPVVQALNAHALVVGNSGYAGSARLANPVNDAAAMARKLTALGFRVTTVSDADRGRLVTALSQFSRSAANADLTLLFYAGHGVQVNGVNYLVPVDFNMNDPAQITYQGVSLNAVLEQSMPGRMKLVFLDACRDNPVARAGTRGGGGRGLARVDVAEGVLIAYATKEGATADDGEGRNSPFTSALLEHLDDPVDVSVMLRKVREKVIRTTGGRQQPWDYGSLVGGELVLSRLRAPR